MTHNTDLRLKLKLCHIEGKYLHFLMQEHINFDGYASTSVLQRLWDRTFYKAYPGKGKTKTVKLWVDEAEVLFRFVVWHSDTYGDYEKAIAVQLGTRLAKLCEEAATSFANQNLYA